MKTLKFTVKPLTAFATPLVGDTLFGHVCWAIRERDGEGRLDELLKDYTRGDPFLVMSDAFPEGLIPRPTAPDRVLGIVTDPSQRKRSRAHRWIPVSEVGRPVQSWMEQVTRFDLVKTSVVSQNTINRLTGTTGTGQFAPRQVDRAFFSQGKPINLYAVFDEARMSVEVLSGLLQDIGLHGYGRDATTGLGKFEVVESHEQHWPVESSQYWLTLAPCAPDPTVLDQEDCYYVPITRFGRHGNVAVRLRNPFKSPILMAATGALLRSREIRSWAVHGRGLGGSSNPISRILPSTVHQGYAPLVPLTMAASS
jgi:CRISPR-associated protein Csm4